MHSSIGYRAARLPVVVSVLDVERVPERPIETDAGFKLKVSDRLTVESIDGHGDDVVAADDARNQKLQSTWEASQKFAKTYS
jgi:hypothetical protein